jgi:phosphatidylinositol alpha-1,6-mannosyltransferase
MKNLVKYSENDIAVLTQEAEETSFDDQSEADVIRDKILGPVGYLKTAWHAFRNRNKDLIHLDSPMNTFTVIPASLLGAKVSAHAHGSEMLYHESDAGFIRQKLFKVGLRSVDRFVVPSDWSKSKLQEFGVTKEDVEVIHPGIDYDRFSQKLEDEKEIFSGEKFSLLTVARIDDRKGHTLVLEAIKNLENIEYVIAGSGPYRKQVEKKAEELGISEKVQLLGRVPDNELVNLYSNCDCFIMPSEVRTDKIECFGIVYLEANAAGKPAIGSDTGGIPSAIKNHETGLLAQPNPEDVKQKIQAIRKNPQKYEEKARKWAKQHDWKRQIPKIDEFWLEISGE